MKLHPSVPSPCHSHCSLDRIGIPDEFTLKILLLILVSFSQPATKFCPSVGAWFLFTPVAVACHKLADAILVITLSTWSGIHIHSFFLSCSESLEKY